MYLSTVHDSSVVEGLSEPVVYKFRSLEKNFRLFRLRAIIRAHAHIHPLVGDDANYAISACAAASAPRVVSVRRALVSVARPRTGALYLRLLLGLEP